MSKSVQRPELDQPVAKTTKQVYKQSLHRLQIELVKLQRHFIASDDKILIVMEKTWSWHNRIRKSFLSTIRSENGMLAK